MGQARLKHILLLNINKERLDALDLNIIAYEFVQGSEDCLKLFGKFS